MKGDSAKKGEAIELSLATLAQDFLHLSSAGGATLAQAAAVCLDQQGHETGVDIEVDGDFTASFKLKWSLAVSLALRRFWNDLAEAAQYGAYAVAILLIRALTGYTVIERSRKGTGFDWWLGTGDNLFQAKARLEVSGILSGSIQRINSRLKARLKQTRQSDSLRLPAFVVVVEFGKPQAKLVRR